MKARRFVQICLGGVVLIVLVALGIAIFLQVHPAKAAQIPEDQVYCNGTLVTGSVEVPAPYVQVLITDWAEPAREIARVLVPVQPDGTYNEFVSYPVQHEGTVLWFYVGEHDGTDVIRQGPDDTGWGRNTEIFARSCHSRVPISGTLRTVGKCADYLSSRLLDCDGSFAQSFTLTSVGGILTASGTCLGVLDSADGTSIQERYCLNHPGRTWRFQNVAVRSATGICLDVISDNWTAGLSLYPALCYNMDRVDEEGLLHIYNRTHTWTYDPASGKLRGRNNLCLTVNNETATNGQPVILWPCHDNDGSGQQAQNSQKWIPGAGGFRSGLDTSKCLDSDRDARKVQVWDCSGAYNQQWALSGPILGRADKCLDADNTGSDRLQIWTCLGGVNQHWDFWMPQDVPNPDVTYKIVNKADGLVVDSGGTTAVGSYTKLWVDVPSDNLRWQFVDTGGGWYKIINKADGLMLDSAGTTTVGSYCKLWSDAISDNLLWQLVDTGGGWYKIVNKADGLMLDSAGTTTAGSYLKLWSDAISDNLLWQIIQAN